jgi:2-C-methyl-D-erythritol 4-phosphate cytidylyltransferase
VVDLPPPRAALVLLAAGEGRRTGHSTNKVLLPLAGRRVFTWSIRWASQLPSVVRTTVVVRPQDEEEIRAGIRREVDPRVARHLDIVPGGDSRHASEWEALQELAPAIRGGEIEVIVIHDAARPLASSDVFEAVVAAAAEHGGAIPVSDHRSLAALDGGDIPGDRVVAVQTPQAFRAAPLLEAYGRAHAEGFVGTDTASCIERYTDLPVRCVPGDATNIKITFPEDLFLAERLLDKAGFDLSGGREQAAAGHHRPHVRAFWPGSGGAG